MSTPDPRVDFTTDGFNPLFLRRAKDVCGRCGTNLVPNHAAEPVTACPLGCDDEDGAE